MRQPKLVCEAIAVAEQAALWMQKEQQQQPGHDVNGGVLDLARGHPSQQQVTLVELPHSPTRIGARRGWSVVTNVDTDELDLRESAFVSEIGSGKEESMAALVKPVHHPSMDDRDDIIEHIDYLY